MPPTPLLPAVPTPSSVVLSLVLKQRGHVLLVVRVPKLVVGLAAVHVAS